MESEASTTPPSTDGNDVSLEKEYLTLLFPFASLLHECASGSRLAYTNCIQNLVLLDSFPNFRPWWFVKQWNIIHLTITSSPVARILNKPLKRLNLSFEFLGQNCSKIASFIMVNISETVGYCTMSAFPILSASFFGGWIIWSFSYNNVSGVIDGFPFVFSSDNVRQIVIFLFHVIDGASSGEWRVVVWFSSFLSITIESVRSEYEFEDECEFCRREVCYFVFVLIFVLTLWAISRLRRN